jgi:hypothetical protein
MSDMYLELDKLAGPAGFKLNSQESLEGITVKGINDFWWRLVGLQEPEAVYILGFDQEHQDDKKVAVAYYREKGQFDRVVDFKNDNPNYYGHDVVHLLLYLRKVDMENNSKGAHDEG